MTGILNVTGLRTTLDGVPTSGMLDRDLIRLAMRRSGASNKRISSLLPQIMHESEQAYLRRCPADLKPKLCPGIPDLLCTLEREGAVLALVTGNLTGIGWKKMECAGLRRHFPLGAFSRDGLTRADLAQAAARSASRKRLLCSSFRVLLIGDHPNDIAAARQNGFGSVAVATGLISEEELAAHKPDLLLPDLTAVKPNYLLSYAKTPLPL